MDSGLIKGEAMRAVICTALICLIFISGCAENYHWTDYCDEFSADRAVEGQERENYNSYITPVSDVATECYCYTEDTVISAAVGTAVVGYTVFIIAPDVGYLLNDI